MANSGLLVRTPANGFQPVIQAEFESVKLFDTIKVTWRKSRNPRFHRKMFALFRFVTDQIDIDFDEVVLPTGEVITPSASLDATREWLVIKAGYYKVYGHPDGSVSIKAESLSYDSMDETKFERVYSAVIDAALLLLPSFKSSGELDAAIDELLRFDS